MALHLVRAQSAYKGHKDTLILSHTHITCQYDEAATKWRNVWEWMGGSSLCEWVVIWKSVIWKSCWCNVLLNRNNTLYGRPCHFRTGLIKCCLVSCVLSTRRICVHSALFDSNERLLTLCLSSPKSYLYSGGRLPAVSTTAGINPFAVLMASYDVMATCFPTAGITS